jgi:hypothetical protein
MTIWISKLPSRTLFCSLSFLTRCFVSSAACFAFSRDFLTAYKIRTLCELVKTNKCLTLFQSCLFFLNKNLLHYFSLFLLCIRDHLLGQKKPFCYVLRSWCFWVPLSAADSVFIFFKTYFTIRYEMTKFC